MRPAPTAFNKAVALLALRPHFTAEVRRKLEQRGYPPEEIDSALQRLVEIGYLDDRKTARGFVEARLAKGGEGTRRIRNELKKRGAPEEAAAEALELLPRDDLELARQVAQRWHRSRSRPKPEALARHLDRKGFTQRSIYTLLDELREGVEDVDDH